MKYKIGVGYLKLDAKSKRYVNEALNANRLSYGKFTKAFEEKFAELHNVKYAIFCSSGTAALQIALAVAKEIYYLNPHDEIIVPAITFPATVNAIIHAGATPVFADVMLDTCNVDPLSVAKNITSKTKGILPVHLFGQPCDMEPIRHLAKTHNLFIIEDSCETMFAQYKGEYVGSFGTIGCFSTYIAHYIVAGIGGFVTTNNEVIADIARSVMNHGRDTAYLSIDDASLDNITSRFRFPRIGYNFRATELESAIGLGQLENWKFIIESRKRNGEYLTKKLAKFKHLRLPNLNNGIEHTFMLYPIITTDKKELVVYLEKHGIETRDIFPIINEWIYKEYLRGQYPRARFIVDNGFYIGCHQGLRQKDLDYIVKIIGGFYGGK